MVYIDPQSGSLEEQHPIKQRKGSIWAKYFNLTLLKGMDEELAEAADDGDPPRERWLWPLTGEVHWQGISFIKAFNSSKAAISGKLSFLLPSIP